jgi:hypothetical protein
VQEKILSWIGGMDYGAMQSDMISSRCKGTGQWLLESPVFISWLNNSREKSLFCHGIPGAGKSIMASIIVEHLLTKAIPQQTLGNEMIGIAFIYCRYSEHARQQPVHLLSAILKQLLQHVPTAAPLEWIRKLYEKHIKSGTRLDFDEAIEAVRKILESFKRIFLVIDALDECQSDTLAKLLPQLRKLQDASDLRILATSRPHESIADEFKDDLKLQIEADSGDVGHYLNDRLSALPEVVQKTPSLFSDVKRTVINAVDGM